MFSKKPESTRYWLEANVFNDNIRSQPLIGEKPMLIQKPSNSTDWQKANILHKYEKSIIGIVPVTRRKSSFSRRRQTAGHIGSKPMFICACC